MKNKGAVKILYKKVGQTPLQVLDEYKKENPKYQDVKMAYAGRLDPMAEGHLLVLFGEACKEREKYLGLDKEYEFEILLDFKTDTQDVLGLAEHKPPFFKKKYLVVTRKFFKKLRVFVGQHNWKYPVFSSKTINGKPLFLWALEGKLDEIEIPRKEIEIYELKFFGDRFIKKEVLHKQILEKINSIPEVKEKSKELGADFRRAEIRQRWLEIFDRIPEDQRFQVLKFKCKCSSGTYMRTLAEKISKKLGRSGLAFSITRTKFLGSDS